MKINIIQKRYGTLFLKIFLLTLFLIGGTTLSFSQVRIIHNPIPFAKANQAIEVSARIEGPFSAADEMRAYYRAEGMESFQYVIIDYVGGEYRGQLPAQSISVGKLEYFLALVQGSEILTLPTSNPYYQPFSLQLTPGEAADQPSLQVPVQLPEPTGDQIALIEDKFLILSPDNGQTITSDEVVIAVSLFFEPGEIDVYKTRMFVDRRTVQPELSEDLITFVPPRIGEGEHEIEVHLFHPDGKGYQPLRWRFQVISPSRGGVVSRPLVAGATGSIYAESRSEKYSGHIIDNNLIGGQFRGQKGLLRYGTRFYLTSLEDEKFQPRNRFLFWLDMNMIKLYAGDTNPRFSELMLNGKRVRGVNAQLNLKIINFDFVMGQTYRAVEGAMISGIQGFGTFKQNLLGLKTSFGSVNGTHWGINLLKVKDDVNSIQNGLKPKDNLIVGSDLALSLFKNRFVWKSEAAFSLLTDDISTGSISKSQIDSLIDGDIPIDPADYEKYLILNTSTIPLDPSELSSLAYMSTLQIRMFRNNITVKYKSIGSAYNSLGNPFIRKNIKGLFINDRIRLFRNRLYLNLGYENYEDNFSQNDDNPIIDLETINYGVSLFPGQGLPNLNVNYKNYTRNNGLIGFDPTKPDDREDNSTSEVTFNINYDVNVFNLNHNLSINYITLDKKDELSSKRLPMTANIPFIPIGINNDIQSVSLQTKYQIPLRTTISYANNENSFIGGYNIFKFNNFDLKADYSLLQNQLNIYAGFRKFNASGGTNSGLPGANLLSSAVIDYAKTQFDIGGRFILNGRHNFIVDMSTINFKDSGGYFDLSNNNIFIANPSFKDYLVRFRYEMQF